MIPIFKICKESGEILTAKARPDQIDIVCKFGWIKGQPDERSSEKAVKKTVSVEKKKEKPQIEKAKVKKIV